MWMQLALSAIAAFNSRVTLHLSWAAISRAHPSSSLGPVATILSVPSGAGKSEANAHEMWVVLMPNANAEKLGLPSERVNASSPWMMLSGTPNAHIMMPQTASMEDAPPPTKQM
jgi:hypothetical protein